MEDGERREEGGGGVGKGNQGRRREGKKGEKRRVKKREREREEEGGGEEKGVEVCFEFCPSKEGSSNFSHKSQNSKSKYYLWKRDVHSKRMRRL